MTMVGVADISPASSYTDLQELFVLGTLGSCVHQASALPLSHTSGLQALFNYDNNFWLCQFMPWGFQFLDELMQTSEDSVPLQVP